MSERNLCAGDINPHHDLCTEVAQTAHGHIGFGPYSALHSNDDGDLAGAGDKNTELGDDEYIFGADLDWEGFPLNVEPDDHELYVFFEQHVYGGESLSLFYYSVPAEKVSHMRSEVLSVRSHHSIKRLQAEDRKHQQFYGNLRVR